MRRKLFDTYFNWLTRHPGKIVLVTVILALCSVTFAGRLKLKSDFVDLLPEDYDSVQKMHEVSEELGGLGYLVITVENDNIDAAKAFSNDLAGKLSSLDEVSYVLYRKHQDFFEKNALLYMSKQDLLKVQEQLKDTIDEAVAKYNPFYLDLMDDEAVKDSPVHTIEEIEAKMGKGKASIEDYFVSRDNQLLVVLVKPRDLSTNMSFTKTLLSKVQRIIDALEPASYDGSLKVQFTGTYVSKMKETERVTGDLISNGISTLVLLILFILIYFRHLRAIGLVMLPLLLSAVLTLAIAYLTIGYLNVITGFIFAILLGLGIDYTIHILIRYKSERSAGHAIRQALYNTCIGAGMSNLTSALTTATAFFTLVFTEFKGFSQFGLIAGIGMIVTLSYVLTFLPALIYLSETWRPMTVKKRFPETARPSSKRLPGKAMVFGTLVVTMLSLFLIPKMSFEENFLALTSQSDDDQKLVHRVDAIFGRSLAPAVVIARDPEEARHIAQVVSNFRDQKGDASTIGTVLSMHSFLPENQSQKMIIINEIRHQLNRKSLKNLPPEQRSRLKELEAYIPAREMGLADLPEDIRLNYRTHDGIEGKIVFIFPRVNLWNGAEAQRFAMELASIRVDNQPVHPTGEGIIFAEMLINMKQEGALAIVLAALAITIILFVDFRKPLAVLIILSPVIIGFLWLCGFMVGLNLKFGFFNIIVLPILLGISVDHGVHFYHRYEQLGRQNPALILRSVGSAVVVNTLTTIIGFSGLITATHRGLNSIGQIAVLGLCLSTICSILFVLGVLQLLTDYRKKKAEKEALASAALAEPNIIRDYIRPITVVAHPQAQTH